MRRGTTCADASTVTTGDFTATGGTVASVSGSGTSFTVTVTASGEGNVTIAPAAGFSVSDVAGNATVGATILADTQVTYDRAVTYDITAPTVTLEKAAGQAAQHRFARRFSGEHDDGRALERGMLSHLGEHLEAIRIGKHHIQQNEVRILRTPERSDDLGSIGRDLGVESFECKVLPQQFAQMRLILDDQHELIGFNGFAHAVSIGFSSSGSLKRNDAPPPDRLSTTTCCPSNRVSRSAISRA